MSKNAETLYYVTVNHEGYVPLVSSSAGAAEHELLDAFPKTVKAAQAFTVKEWEGFLQSSPSAAIAHNLLHIHNLSSMEAAADETARQDEDDREEAKEVQRRNECKRLIQAVHEAGMELYSETISRFEEADKKAAATIVANCCDPDGATFKQARYDHLSMKAGLDAAKERHAALQQALSKLAAQFMC